MMPCEAKPQTAGMMLSAVGQREAGRWEAPGSPGLGSAKAEKHLQFWSEFQATPGIPER